MRKYLNKIIIIILLIILSLIVLNYFNNDSKMLETKVNNLKETSTPGTIEISNPVFKNKGLNTNPYEITAKKGIHIKNDIELYVVFGKFTNDNSELIYIKADKGFYNQNNQSIELIGNVLIYDDIGNKTTTNTAIIDIDNKIMNLTDNIVSVSGTSTIKSNSSVIDEKNNSIVYSGNVKVKIENK
jgi:LPS export ABC transporter protein LptC